MKSQKATAKGNYYTANLILTSCCLPYCAIDQWFCPTTSFVQHCVKYYAFNVCNALHKKIIFFVILWWGVKTWLHHLHGVPNIN